MKHSFKNLLQGVFLNAAGVFSAAGAGIVAHEVEAADVNPLYQNTMNSGERIDPMKRASTSVVWVIGEDEPLFADADKGQDIDDPYNQQFYTSSLVKPIVYLAAMRKIEADKGAVSNGEMSPEDALDYDSFLTISERAKSLSSHRSFENEMSVRQALPLLLSFSMNDIAHAFAERVANGKTVPRDISVKESKDLEQKFVLNHMRPLISELGMDNTFIVNSTGLPTYSNKRRAIPTWYNNVSTPRDMVTLFNHISDHYPDYIDLSSVAEVKMPNRVKPFKNSNPLLESSTRNNGRAQSIPVDGVEGGKTGLSAVSLWNAVLYYEVGDKRLGVLSTGNDNAEYARVPKEALEKGVEALELRSTHENNIFSQLQYCPMPENDM